MKRRDPRPIIPSDLERSVLLEAGHRCAIHTCRQTPIEIAHIVAWAKCREHRFDNLIALCPTCHTRYDKGEIDRKSMLTYKMRLAEGNGRYGELERRFLRVLSEQEKGEGIWLLSDLQILIGHLLADGLLVQDGPDQALDSAGTLSRRRYKLTSQGNEYIAALKSI